MSYIENKNRSEINIGFNHINVQVFQLLEDLEVAGNTSNPRGLKCREANLAELDIDPRYPCMNYESRKFNFRYLAGELAWYLKGDSNIDFINNFSSFWKNIATAHTGSGYHANSNYGDILFNLHPDTRVGDAEFRGGVNQLEWVYNSLAKDKDTRQAVAFFNSPIFQYPENKDFVCTMYVNFWIRKDFIDMKVQMRSNDIFYGLSYDAPWFSSLHQSMYLLLKRNYPELKLGMYYHYSDNIHYYERHFELVENILDSDLSDSIKMELKYPLFDFKDGRIFITEEAKSFIEKVDKIVESGNIPKDQEFWKQTLSSLYNIS